ncbi:AAA-type ATPase family protein [Artemisia annua]|uniref:AAA-type ATPase family protein n=1 Tax=Artemisia annua TaxID=35608 RepID=A0A2U1LK38_ARTAN|nr:AAA-type ATPase family protein [Artemisia annua]
MDCSDLKYKKVKLDETAVECIRFKSKLTDFSKLRQRNEKYVSPLFHCSGTHLWHHLKHNLVQKTLMASKDGDSDIVDRMRKISEEENLDVDCDALYLIALNVEGSLHDAETMLDQLSLLGKRTTTDVVNELLMELLELAMSSNTADTVKRARELMDLGIDPMVLMSQMAKLIMDIIAGTYQVVEARYVEIFIPCT